MSSLSVAPDISMACQLSNRKNPVMRVVEGRRGRAKALAGQPEAPLMAAGWTDSRRLAMGQLGRMTTDRRAMPTNLRELQL